MPAKKPSNETNIAVISTNIEDIKKDVSEIKGKLESNYVTKEAFEPIRRIVYGMVSLVLISVVGALLTLILRNTAP